MTNSSVKCARHNVPLQGEIINGKPKGTFSCPVCGVGDTHENIMREIREYATEQAADKLSDTLERATRGSKSLTFKKSRRPKKAHRFVVDLGIR